LSDLCQFGNMLSIGQKLEAMIAKENSLISIPQIVKLLDSFTINETNMEVFERLIKIFEKIIKTPQNMPLLSANQQVRLIRSFSMA
jgi:hypothetical protein